MRLLHENELPMCVDPEPAGCVIGETFRDHRKDERNARRTAARYSRRSLCATITDPLLSHSLLIPMDTLDVAPQVRAGRGVTFTLPGPQGVVECMVTIRALQDCFWLEPNSDDVRTLRAFRNGYGRIRAIAERKMLAHPATQLELTAADFSRP